MIKKVISGNEKVIIPGFFGYTKENLISTFSRGGSDLTGSYIASSINADIYENFTDKEGILAADPNIVKNPKLIKYITYKEMRDLSYSGFNIFHQEAMLPLEESLTEVHLRNTFEYPKEGTRIISERILDSNKPIIGIAYKPNFCSFDIEMSNMNEKKGIAYNILKIFFEKDISIEYMPSAIDDISVIVKESEFKDNVHLNNILKRLKKEFQKSSIEFQNNLGCLVVAGKGLAGYKGISGNIQQTLAKANINLKFISQGSKEMCIIYGINQIDGKKAVNTIYQKYIL